MNAAAEHIWVIGGGGHAKVAVAVLQAAGHAVCGVFDDNPATWGGLVLGVPIRGAVPEPPWWRDNAGAALLAIGNNAVRRRLAERLMPLDGWRTAIHPAAVVHPTARIQNGTLVCAGAVVQPDVAIGAHAIINTGAIVEHDCRIGDFVHAAPRACLTGAATVGEGALIGAGATVLPGIRVGAWSRLGAGALLHRDLSDGCTAAGVPARPLDPASPDCHP